ncbi:HNH endonuclease signature motif containing protein [Arthrobacter monumenti]
MDNAAGFSTGSGTAAGSAAAALARSTAGTHSTAASRAAAGSAVVEGMADELRVLSHQAAAGTAGVVEAGEAALFAHRVEELSRTVEHLQVVAAGRLEQVRSDAESEGKTTSWVSADGKVQQEYRHTADYLRAALRIGRSEAAKRVRLAATLLPTTGMTGAPVPPVHEHLAEAMADGDVSTKAATAVTMALRKAKPLADPVTLARMEESLTATAAEQDPDFVNIAAARWMNHIDQDGAEPSEEVLRHRQGIFTRTKRAGLHHLEIFATDDQYEHLITTVNTAANPRARGCGIEDPDPADVSRADEDEASADAGVVDGRSRPQKLLDGLVAACKAALAAGGMPATGGHRPQVMAVIDYQDLINDLDLDSGTGSYTYTGPVTAQNIRKLACDAEIMPVILSSEGRILDAGPGQRLFPPHLRKALIARDGGCAFPGCYMPASWCEAHHIDYWSKNGATSTDNGVLACSFHHHLIHKEKWRIHVENGVPWFIPPQYVDPYQKPLRNHYFDRKPHTTGHHQTSLPLPATG